MARTPPITTLAPVVAAALLLVSPRDADADANASAVTGPIDAWVDNRAPDAIYGGDIVPQGMWPEVVAVEVNGFLCTGTVVAERLVLTAAHCFNPGINPASIHVSFGENVYTNELSTVATAYGLHPDFCADTSECKEDIHDYAYVVLRDRVTGISFPRVMGTQDEWDTAMFIGSEITLVGFGLDETLELGIKKQVTTTIQAFSQTGGEFRAGGEGKDSCQGDSGGPAFVRLPNNEFVLAGITSRGYDCGVGGFYGVPYPVLCWIEEETGVNLKRDGCGACDCLQTDPARHGGCSVTPPETRLHPATLLLLLLLGARRRRRRSMIASWR